MCTHRLAFCPLYRISSSHSLPSLSRSGPASWSLCSVSPLSLGAGPQRQVARVRVSAEARCRRQASGGSRLFLAFLFRWQQLGGPALAFRL